MIFSTRPLFVTLAFFFTMELFSQQKKEQNLQNIQQSIRFAFLDCYQELNQNSLDSLSSSLESNLNKNNLKIINYWRAYAKYYAAVCYGNSDRELSQKYIEEAIEILDDTPDKTSELYALYSYITPFYFQFANYSEIPIISGKLNRYALKAIELDEKNLRAWFVAANMDFYTPEEYGGGKKAKEYVLKAIELDEQEIENPYLPSWGKDEAYALLINLYLKNNELEKAANYFEIASQKYPESYTINLLASNFKNND